MSPHHHPLRTTSDHEHLGNLNEWLFWIGSCVGPAWKRVKMYALMRRSIRNFNIPPPGIPRAFDCALCPGRGEFERCVERVGNLNRIYLLF